MAIPAWLPVTISSAGTILAFAAFAWQVHRARFNQSVDLLFKQENDFFGPAKKDFVAFVSTLRKFQSERSGNIPYRSPSPEQVTSFLEEELTETT